MDNTKNIVDTTDPFQKLAELTDEKVDSYIRKELANCGFNVVIICPSKNVTYNNVKIPVKNIKTKTKNKFLNRYVLNRVTPTNVTTKEQGDYKFSVDVMLTYNK